MHRQKYTRQKIFLLPVHEKRVEENTALEKDSLKKSLKSVALKSTFVAVENCCPEKDSFFFSRIVSAGEDGRLGLEV